MSRVYRYHIPAATEAAVVLHRRCAAASSDVKRLPVATTDAAGAPCFVRTRTERTRGNRQSHDHSSKLSLEIDLPATNGTPARRVDFRLPVDAAEHQRWLSALGRGYIADECTVWRGTWGGALLMLEEREHGKYLLEVVVSEQDTWTMPEEWRGAVDVTDDPAWARHLVCAARWPVSTMRPLPPQPAVAWGAPLDPASEPCEGADQ